MARIVSKRLPNTRARPGVSATGSKARKLKARTAKDWNRQRRQTRYAVARAFRSWIAGDPSGLDELKLVMEPALSGAMPRSLSDVQRNAALHATWQALAAERDDIAPQTVYLWLRKQASREAARLLHEGQKKGRAQGAKARTNSDVSENKRGWQEPDEYAETVAGLVTTAVKKTLDANPGASLISPEAMAAAIADLVVDNVGEPTRNELADLLAPFWTAERARSALEISRPSMAERRARGSVLAVRTTDGDFFYPVAQFERADGRVRVKPALRTFFMALREHDPWTVGVYLHTPAPELDDLTPLDWVRSGRDPGTLKTYAQVLDAELSR